MSDTQVQAEDRRAQIQARLDAVSKGEWIWNPTVRNLSVWQGRYALPIHEAHPEHNWDIRDEDAELIAHAPDDIRWLLAELSRLSSVEQALRDILDRHCYKTDDIVASFNAMASRMLNLQWVCQQYGASVGLDGKALSASPEAQPEEGR